jgi:DUF438 domain-containing protein
MPDSATGLITPEQLGMIINSLPVEITFVDENDIVRYYSTPKDMMFTRKPENIGVTVQNCHSPESRPMVQEILDKFRDGSQDYSEFWFDLDGKFVHIMYFALRDGDGSYRGILEVAQDLTRARGLKGEQKELVWK